ncbi:MFS transporter [Planctomycetota bacterium]
MSEKNYKFQWAQLLTLTAIHFLIDMTGGMLPALLPKIREKFGLTLTAGVAILTVLNIACNLGQILTGHTRATKTNPLLLPLGLFLSASLCWIAVVSQSATAFAILNVIVVVTGVGIAIMHPESLRAIHGLDKISPAMSTAVFMSGGFIGFASGGLVATSLVSWLGWSGMFFILISPAVGISLIKLFKIRLAVENDSARSSVDPEQNRYPFSLVMAMAIPLAAGSTILIALLPTRLAEFGFTLVFGGYPALLLGVGAAVGSFFWAAVANRKGALVSSIIALLTGLPFLIAYLALIKFQVAIILLFATGFCSTAAYPMVVTMARHAVGFNLGRRMGFIVGGSWGAGSVILMLVTFIAEKFGMTVQHILLTTPVCYLLSAIIAIVLMRKNYASVVD